MKETENDNKTSEKLEIDKCLFQHFIEINEDAKAWLNVTPRHFMLFIKTFLQIKENKENSILDNEHKLKASSLIFIDFFANYMLIYECPSSFSLGQAY